MIINLDVVAFILIILGSVVAGLVIGILLIGTFSDWDAVDFVMTSFQNLFDS